MSTPKLECIFCRSPKSHTECEMCGNTLCKKCVQIMSDETFKYKTDLSQDLKHTQYCPYCFDETVAPALENYNRLLEKAKNVGVWSKNYRGTIPVIKKSRDPISLNGQDDKHDLVLRLGFMAAELGFNGLIRAEITSKKIRLAGKHSKQTYDVTALPVLVDEEKVNRDEFNEAHWRTIFHS